jgi:hypothetical protein
LTGIALNLGINTETGINVFFRSILFKKRGVMMRPEYNSGRFFFFTVSHISELISILTVPYKRLITTVVIECEGSITTGSIKAPK